MKEENEYPLYPELTEEGKKQAQELMIKFEKTLKESATKIISEFSTDFYCEILHEIESDHWTNYRQKIVNGLCDYKNKTHATYDFKLIREAIYRQHKEEITKDLNQDLLKKIKELEDQLETSYKFGF